MTVYDDFAHHPTAIATTLQGLRKRVGAERILLVLEPRSNTMQMGVHRDTLGAAMHGADAVWLYQSAQLGWSLGDVAGTLAMPAAVLSSIDEMVGGRDRGRASRRSHPGHE